MISVAVVEDQEKDRNEMSKALSEYQHLHNVVFEVKYFKDGLDFLGDKNFFDMVFLDIELPYMNGIKVAKKYRENNKNSILIFVTNMGKLAIQGYEVDATDFIVKPLRVPVFLTKMEKYVSIAKSKQKKSLLLHTKSADIFVNINDIRLIEVAEHKVYFYTANQTYEVWGTLKLYVSEMPPEEFVLCNSGCMVNLKYVESIGADTITCNGKVISLSRAKRKNVIEAATKYMLNK